MIFFPIVTDHQAPIQIQTFEQLCSILEYLPEGKEKEEAYGGLSMALPSVSSITCAERESILDCLVELDLISTPST
jgi:hypothetical protein